MAKSRQQKEQIVLALSDKLKGATSVVISSFTALSVNDDQALRAKMHEHGVSYSVISKTLLSKALENAKLDAINTEGAQGNIAVALSDDGVLAAKTVHEFSKEHEGADILGGFFEKELVDGTRIKALASLPSKDELIAKTVWSIKGPLSGFVGVLSGTMRSLVYALSTIQEKRVR